VDRVKKISGYGYVLKNSGEFVLNESIRMAYTLFDANRKLRTENSARRATEEELTALYTHTPVLMLLVDKDRRVRKANAFAGQFAGTPAEEMIGKRGGEALRCLHHLDDPKGCGFGPFCKGCAVKGVVRNTLENGETYHRTEATLPFLQQGEEQELTFLVSTSLLQKGNEELCLLAFEDVTDYKQLEEKYRLLFDYSNDAIFVHGIEADNMPGKNIEVNARACELLGYSREELLSMSARDAVPEDQAAAMTTHGRELIERRRLVFETENTRRDGVVIPVEVSAYWYQEKGKQFAVASVRDITERRQATMRLRESEKLFRHMFHRHHAVMLLIDPDTGKIVNANAAASRYYGFSVDELCRMSIEQINTMPAEEVAYERARAAEEKRNHFFFSHRLSNGELRDVEVHSTLIEISGQKSLFSIIHDVTERKRAEEALQESVSRFDELIANLPVGVYIVWIRADGRTNFVYVSDRWCAIHKVRREDVMADAATVNDQVHPDERQAFFERNLEAARDHKPFLWEGRFVVGDGDLRWLRLESNPTIIENGDIRWFGVTQDITERRQTEEKLQLALEEKDFLMRELNHRIKNNLSMVSSLINLKASDTDADLSDIQHQIDAIGLIHAKLHRTENVTEIRCRDYFDDLLSSIFTSFAARHVKIEKDIDDIRIPTKSAMSLGLIVNEIATNAIKHGFTDEEEAVFFMKMEEDQKNSGYEVTLSNTGQPFPEEIDIDSAQTLGLRLTSALTAQLDGTIELQRAPRPVFTIWFPMGDE
jgi:PAS domain S-box-containing protein